jgi:hypothetical protein
MMRTIEVLIVIIIITGAFIAASFFAVLPLPREVSPMTLRRLSFTTLHMLDSNYELSRAAFETDNYTIWGGLQVALSASLPPNVIYNLTVYEVTGETTQLYTYIDSMSNAESLGATSDASTYIVASSNVTFNVVPEKIGEHDGGGTLYILNCSDAKGWWITGYTSHSLAQDLYNLLSPYFLETVMVQSTSQFERILNNNTLQGETVQNAVVINTCGEAVPIPAGDYATQGSANNYAKYCYILGQRVRQYNWTWASIVGYPFYYVSNAALFAGQENTYGIYGMQKVDKPGMNAFLQGLDNKQYSSDSTDITGSSQNPVYLLPNIMYYCNYYGIYPSPSQTSTRALSTSILRTDSSGYNLTLSLDMFSRFNDNYIPSAVYRHVFRGSTDATGSLLALGLTRSPDIRLTALGILSYYAPRLYHSEYAAKGTSRLVVLQLGLVGGV